MTGTAHIDKAMILARIAAGKRRLLASFGAHLVAEARGLIQPSPGTSPPGQPPYSHTNRFEELIQYAVDGSSVIAGAIPLRPGSRVPATIEFGGRVVGRNGRSRYHRPRPVMRPAFLKSLQSDLAARLRGLAG